MSWTTLQYSKKEIRRAGDYLSQDFTFIDLNDTEFEKIQTAFDKIANWRASHAYPIQTVLGFLRKQAFEVEKRTIVVQHLRPMPSILQKLRYESEIKLDRIEDIASCRAVVPTLNKVYQLRDSIKLSRTRNRLKRVRDYIQFPKQSGYRGIHLIYKYNGS